MSTRAPATIGGGPRRQARTAFAPWRRCIRRRLIAWRSARSRDTSSTRTRATSEPPSAWASPPSRRRGWIARRVAHAGGFWQRDGAACELVCRARTMPAGPDVPAGVGGKRRLYHRRADAGDIVAIAGLKTVTTGDTLCDTSKPIIIQHVLRTPQLTSHGPIYVPHERHAALQKLCKRLRRAKRETPSHRISCPLSASVWPPSVLPPAPSGA